MRKPRFAGVITYPGHTGRSTHDVTFYASEMSTKGANAVTLILHRSREMSGHIHRKGFSKKERTGTSS